MMDDRDTSDCNFPSSVVVAACEDDEDIEEKQIREQEIENDLKNAFDGLDEDDILEHSSSSEYSDQDQESHIHRSSKNTELHSQSFEASSEQSDTSQSCSLINGEDSRHSYVGSQQYDHGQGTYETNDSNLLVNDHSYGNEKKHVQHNYYENNSSISNIHPHYAKNPDSNPINSAKHSIGDSDLQDEFLKLKILYENNCQELEENQRRLNEISDTTSRKIRTLELQMQRLEDEKERLSSSLQTSQDLLSDFRHQNSVLQGKLSATEIQLSAEIDAKNKIQSKLDTHEITIQALENHIKQLSKSDTLSRLQKDAEKVVEDIKFRHQKEVLNYQKMIDSLKSELNSKSKDMNNLEHEKSQLKKKCGQLEKEKGELVDKFSVRLDASQQQCEQLLQSGNLKLKVQELEKKKEKLEEQNSEYKEEIKSLKNEIHTLKVLQDITAASLCNAKTNAVSQSKKKETNLESELKHALETIGSLRSSNALLKKKTEDLEEKLCMCEERATLFESRATENEENVKILKEELNSLTSVKSIPLSSHEDKVKALENELEELKQKHQDITEKLKRSTSNEKKMQEICKRLQNQIKEMVERHAEEKLKAINECREECLMHHESTVKIVEQELKSKADTEVMSVRYNYEDRIVQLEKELKVLNEQLYDSKTQYINTYEENKVLQKKLDEISKPKERLEIEEEVRSDYEKKLCHIKEKLQQENAKILDHCIKNELMKIQVEWTKQKMTEVEEFVENTKKNLDAKFQACLLKEQQALQQQLEEEKAKFQKIYKEEINLMQKEFEKQKLNLSSKLNEEFKTKFEDKTKSLKKMHGEEMKNIKYEYEKKLNLLENEIENLKKEASLLKNNQNELMLVKENFLKKQEDWERERQGLLSSVTSLKLTVESSAEIERALQEKVSKYQKHISALEKHYKQKCSRLQTQISSYQKSENEQIFLVKEKYEQELKKLCEAYKHTQCSLKNRECQTEEEMVPKQQILSVKNMFLACLRNIAVEVRNYLEDAKKRSIERQRQILLQINSQLSSQMYQDISKNLHSYTPSLIIPNTKAKNLAISNYDDVFEKGDYGQNFCSTKIKTSTPSVPNILDNDNNNPLKDSKSVSNEVSSYAGLFSKLNAPECLPRFEDISFDFIPLKLPQSASNSGKLSSVVDFVSETNEFLQNRFPVKLKASQSSL